MLVPLRFLEPLRNVLKIAVPTLLWQIFQEILVFSAEADSACLPACHQGGQADSLWWRQPATGCQISPSLG